MRKLDYRYKDPDYHIKWWAKQGPETRMFYAAKTRAKQNGIPFDIEKSDIVVPDVCPYFGTPLKVNHGSKKEDSPSLDRIDNIRGYVKGNVQVISDKANIMKQDVSIEQLIKFAKAILERHDLP